MIDTYFIAGYAIKEPYLNKKMKKEIKANPELYDSLSKIVALVLIDDKKIMLKELFRCKNGNEIYHKYSKRTNWYKFTHAVFRMKDSARMIMSDEKKPEHFVGKYISYNTLTKKWIYTNDKLKKKFKLNDMMKDFISFNIGIRFYLLPEVF